MADDELRDADALREAMTRSAQAEKAEIEQDAQSRTLAIEDDAATRIAEHRRRALDELDKECQRYRERLMSEALVELRAQKLAIKHRLLDEAFAQARAELERPADTKRMQSAMKRLGESALIYAGDGAVLQPVGDGDPGTVLAMDATGLRVVDNGMRSRLIRARTQLLPELSRILFPADEAKA